MSTRGRGGKFTKPKRGGGKHFSRNLQPLNADGELDSMWAAPREKAEDEDSSEEEEDSSEEESSDDAGPAQKGPQQEMTREERRAAAKKRKEAAKAKLNAAAPGDMPSSDSEDDEEDDDMPANPNHTAKAKKQAADVPVKGEDESDATAKKKVTSVGQLSRREREALQAQQAKERYQKLHAEGKTDEARADLERLRLVKERREADAARKKAEAEEKAENDKAKREQLERMARQKELKANKLSNKKKK